jgi:TonB family protein
MLDSPKRSALLSVALHGGAIVLLLALTGVNIPVPASVHERLVVPIDIAAYRATAAKGGGSGGTRSLPASIGRPPKPSPHPFTPPVVATHNDNPKQTIEPAILAASDTQLPTIDLAQFGDIFGVHGPPSNGTGDGGGIGRRHGTGVGDSNGPGFGDGPGGGGVSGSGRIEGWLTAPVLLWKNEPEFTEEARRAKIQGSVILRIEIDERGQVRNVSVTHGLGLGLDERAIDAVQHWKFRPASRNGKPAASSALVEVNFRLL